MTGWLSSFKAGAWLLANWQLALALFGAASLALTGAYFKGRSDGYDLRVSEEAAAAAAARLLNDESAGQAAVDREKDEAKATDNQKERDNAIEASETDGDPSAASNALNCQRLREAGVDLSQFPAC